MSDEIEAEEISKDDALKFLGDNDQYRFMRFAGGIVIPPVIDSKEKMIKRINSSNRIFRAEDKIYSQVKNYGIMQISKLTQ